MKSVEDAIPPCFYPNAEVKEGVHVTTFWHTNLAFHPLTHKMKRIGDMLPPSGIPTLSHSCTSPPWWASSLAPWPCCTPPCRRCDTCRTPPPPPHGRSSHPSPSDPWSSVRVSSAISAPWLPYQHLKSSQIFIKIMKAKVNSRWRWYFELVDSGGRSWMLFALDKCPNSTLPLICFPLHWLNFLSRQTQCFKKQS